MYKDIRNVKAGSQYDSEPCAPSLYQFMKALHLTQHNAMHHSARIDYSSIPALLALRPTNQIAETSTWLHKGPHTPGNIVATVASNNVVSYMMRCCALARCRCHGDLAPPGTKSPQRMHTIAQVAHHCISWHAAALSIWRGHGDQRTLERRSSRRNQALPTIII